MIPCKLSTGLGLLLTFLLLVLLMSILIYTRLRILSLGECSHSDVLRTDLLTLWPSTWLQQKMTKVSLVMPVGLTTSADSV